jgi:hypothetical protein
MKERSLTRGNSYRGNPSNYGRGRGNEQRGKRPARDSNRDRNVGPRWGEIQFVANAVATLGPNATTIHVAKVFARQKILVATETDVDVLTFADATTIVHPLHTRPTNKVVATLSNTNYYQQQQQPGVTRETQGQDSNLEARETTNNTVGEKYFMNNEKQENKPCGALIPAREAVSQGQKIVRETTSHSNNKITPLFYSPCSQNITPSKINRSHMHFPIITKSTVISNKCHDIRQ